jgi:hypothetical protein
MGTVQQHQKVTKERIDFAEAEAMEYLASSEVEGTAKYCFACLPSVIASPWLLLGL